jgi:hypothetical protein
LLNRPRGDKCSKQGKPSQAKRGPKKLGGLSPVRTKVRISTSGKPCARSSARMPASGASRLRLILYLLLGPRWLPDA